MPFEKLIKGKSVVVRVWVNAAKGIDRVGVKKEDTVILGIEGSENPSINNEISFEKCQEIFGEINQQCKCQRYTWLNDYSAGKG